MKKSSWQGRKLIVVTAGLVAATLAYTTLKRDGSPDLKRDDSHALELEELTVDPRLKHEGLRQEASFIEAGTSTAQNAPTRDQVSEETRNFLSSQTCAFSRRSKAQMEHELKLCNLPEDARRNPDQAALVNFCKKRERDFHPALKRVDQALSQCGDSEQAEEAFYAATLAAAKAGDTDAQLCYVRSNFDLKRPWSGEEKALYSQLAPTYIQQSFERGDWRFIELLRSTSSAIVDTNSLLVQVTSGEENYRYRMHRLLQRGAQGKYADFLKHTAKAPVGLSPSQVQESDIWVDQMFERYFKRSPKISDMPTACRLNPVTYSPGDI
jgi:hypothetical protein